MDRHFVLGLSSLVATLACSSRPTEPEKAAPERAAPQTAAPAAAPLAPPGKPFEAGAIAPADAHPFSVLDLLAAERITDPQVSPDGSQVVFVQRSTDLEANRGRTDLWRVDAAGGEPQRLTDALENDDEPRFSPDGATVYFLSKREKTRQLYAVPVTGGAARKITDLPIDVHSFAIAPDGKTVALALETFIDCPTLACTAERLQSIAAAKDTGRRFDRLFVRHWDAWADGRRTHLFAMPLSGGDPVDVSIGLDGDVPSKPSGGAEEYTFTPDSRGLVFSARVQPQDEAWSTNFDLYHAPIDGSSKPVNLTAQNPAWDTRPVFVQGGKALAYLAMKRPGYEADRFALMIKDWPDGSPRELAPTWDRSVEDLAVSQDGTTLLLTAQDRGEQALFAVALADGAVTRLAGKGTILSPSQRGNRIFFARSDFSSPAEVFSIAADGTDERVVTSVNAAAVGRARKGEWEQWSFKGARGDTVYGYIVKPVDFDPGKRYPLALLIHGGPQGSFANGFSYRWHPQAFAGAGYVAIMIDFHGSTGYGQAFTDSIRNDWGGKPFEDLMKGLDAALERWPFIDRKRMCALGGSYGGYMVNWIAGKAPHRFACLVNHDGVFDHRAMYYETEELWFPEWEHEGRPWERPANYERDNPVNLVGQWKTPMLVIHGENDFRVPVTQGLATFTALQRRGIPSRFLHFPDENHWVLAPNNSRRWYQEVLGWLDEHTREGGAP